MVGVKPVLPTYPDAPERDTGPAQRAEEGFAGTGYEMDKFFGLWWDIGEGGDGR
jgi:hypothetical protein